MTLADRSESGVRQDAFVFCNRFANPNTQRGCYHGYVRVRCNDTSCPSTALFHLDTALMAVGANFPPIPEAAPKVK